MSQSVSHTHAHTFNWWEDLQSKNFIVLCNRVFPVHMIINFWTRTRASAWKICCVFFFLFFVESGAWSYECFQPPPDFFFRCFFHVLTFVLLWWTHYMSDVISSELPCRWKKKPGTCLYKQLVELWECSRCACHYNVFQLIRLCFGHRCCLVSDSLRICPQLNWVSEKET